MAITINGTTGIAGVDGSASTPAVQGTDTNTGIFFPAADTIAFGEGGAEAMRIDSSGNVMIGTTSQNGKLTVVMPTGSGSLGIQTGSITADSTRLQSGGSVNNWLEYRGYLGHAWFVDATERMRIDSSGNVGIGSTSPSTYVDASTSLVIQASSGRSGLTLVSNQTVANEILGRISFTDSGSTNSSYRNAIIDGVRGSDDNSAYLTFSTSNSGNPAERARITSDGKFLVNETAQLAGYNQQATITCSGSNVLALALKASGSGNIALATTSTDTSTYNAAVFANNGNFSGALKGSISVSNSATTYNTTSDYRLKENIAPMTGALATVAQLKPCTYTWKDGGEIGQGFIAHELQAVVPDCVTGEKDAVNDDGKPIYQGVDTSFLVATLTAAIQELKAELDTTKARLAALEAQ